MSTMYTMLKTKQGRNRPSLCPLVASDAITLFSLNGFSWTIVHSVAINQVRSKSDKSNKLHDWSLLIFKTTLAACFTMIAVEGNLIKIVIDSNRYWPEDVTTNLLPTYHFHQCLRSLYPTHTFTVRRNRVIWTRSGIQCTLMQQICVCPF